MAVCWILPLALVFVFIICDVCCRGQTFSPHLGQNITLTCQVSNNATIIAAWWARRDLKSEYVFYYRDGQSDPDIQHPSFKRKVVLAESDLKDGNLSVVLMNVNSSDYGEYTCGFKERKEGTVVKKEFTCNITLTKPGAEKENYMDENTERAILKTDPITVIDLKVTGAEKEHSMRGNTESEHPVNGPFPPLHIGLAAGGVAVLLVAAAVFVIWMYKRRTDQRSKQPAAAEAGNNQPMLTSAV